MNSGDKRIYWANALFSDADRQYNERCASKLRELGYYVFLPQDTTMTFQKEPSSEEIFSVDTDEIRNCDILVACLDQFPIDTGVACEVGVAYALGKIIVGLYTDIRANREGDGKMYKNQYVLGAIKSTGTITYSFEELIDTLQSY